MFYSLESLSHGVDTTPRLRGRKALRALLSTFTERPSLEDIRDVYQKDFGLIDHKDAPRLAHMSDKDFEVSIVNSIKQFTQRSLKYWAETNAKIQGKQIKKELAKKEINEPQYVVDLRMFTAGQTAFNKYLSALKQIMSIPIINNGVVVSFDEWIREVTHLCQPLISSKLLVILDTSPYIKGNAKGYAHPWMEPFGLGYNGDGEFSGRTFGQMGYTDPTAIKTAFNVVRDVANDTAIYAAISDVIKHVSAVTKSQHTDIISRFTKDKIDPNGKKIALSLLSFLAIICDTQYEIVAYYEDDITYAIKQAYGVEPYFESKELAEDYGWND